MTPLTRRLLLSSLPTLAGCAAPLPPRSALQTTPAAAALLQASADAHGAAALAGVADISVSYDGHWRPLVGSLQPTLVDSGYRGLSQERLVLRERLVAQSYSGPSGSKQVVRRDARGDAGSVTIWLNGTQTADGERRDAAALVADGYSLFLLGPMLLAGHWGVDRALVMERAGSERMNPGDGGFLCDRLRVSMAPGLGFSPADQLLLFIDQDTRLMRRVRFTLDGLEGTRGAVAEVDTADHAPLHGVLWPTRFHEQLLRPLPLPVHDWRLTGLDLNRGFGAADLTGPAFAGLAAPPAAPLPG